MDTVISEVYWFDGDQVSEYKLINSSEVYKWTLVEKDRKIILMAMPSEAGINFHNELLEKVSESKGWRSENIRSMGGGVRFGNGEIVHKSTHFGRIPAEYQNECLRLLGLSV